MEFKAENNRYIKSLLTLSVIAALVLSTVGVAYAAGLVNFTVLRSPLRVRLVLPKKATPGIPVDIRAVVRNAGVARMKEGTIRLSLRPRTVHSRSLKSFSFLKAGERRVFKWRVAFPKRGVYTLTAVARARQSAKTLHISGARKRLRARY